MRQNIFPSEPTAGHARKDSVEFVSKDSVCYPCKRVVSAVAWPQHHLRTVFFAVKVLFPSSCISFPSISHVHVSSEWDRVRTCLCFTLYTVHSKFNCIVYSAFFLRSHDIPINIFMSKNTATWTYILFMSGQRGLIK